MVDGLSPAAFGGLVMIEQIEPVQLWYLAFAQGGFPAVFYVLWAMDNKVTKKGHYHGAQWVDIGAMAYIMIGALYTWPIVPWLGVFYMSIGLLTILGRYLAIKKKEKWGEMVSFFR